MSTDRPHRTPDRTPEPAADRRPGRTSDPSTGREQRPATDRAPEAKAAPLRRRGAAMRRAVLDATVRLLADGGLEAASVAAVAAAAGVHETSVYRNWGTREELLREALADYTDHAMPLPDTGTLRGDLRQLLTALGAFLDTPEGPALLHLSIAPQNADARSNRDAYWADRLARAEQLLQRAAERGEIRADADHRAAVEALMSPLFARHLLLGEPVTVRFVDALVDLVIGGLAPR
ncbi:TetR-like C-terminal domain-containing protein [Streptomyces sp. TLI_171]|uniref:TetR-like C-terminal domain-containing protein n=1 Tax=Streptomyces sp. TLI_171 TaxID=1938859 RepID=UPI000C516866|nr:TetR-like C-terminal domain-containing protein [Streptomyces sp. TLI_171]RKE23111.1 TetR family transcriptional regulator [Streptomyces sp. TLI_171]